MVSRRYCRELAASLRQRGLVVVDAEELFDNLRELEAYHGVSVNDAVIRRHLGRLSVPSMDMVSQGSRRMAHSPA